MEKKVDVNPKVTTDFDHIYKLAEECLAINLLRKQRAEIAEGSTYPDPLSVMEALEKECLERSAKLWAEIKSGEDFYRCFALLVLSREQFDDEMHFFVA